MFSAWVEAPWCVYMGIGLEEYILEARITEKEDVKIQTRKE